MNSEPLICRRPPAFFPVVCGGYALLGGAVTLFGWLANVPGLTDWDGDGITMFGNTALMAMAGGAAVLLQASGKRWAVVASRILGILITLLGTATLIEHLAETDLGIDQLFVRAKWGDRAAMAPGRPGPPAAISFALLGLALTLLSCGARARRFVPGLGIFIIAIAGLSLVGYVFDADRLYAVSRFTGIAMQSATMILALALGITAAVSERQPMRALLESSAAGALARRALPGIVGIPVVLGWWRLSGQRAGLFDLNMGTALLVISLIALLCTLLWWCVAIVSGHEKILRAKEIALMQEIAERKRTEKELCLAADQAREASRAKDDFLAALSHELRTPLSPALMTSAALENDQSLPDGVREQLTVIRRNIQLEARLIDDLLDLTRISHGKLLVHPVLTNLHDLIQHAQNTLSEEIQQKCVELRFELEAAETYVQADPTRLLQVLWNLLKNAIKFTPAGGCVTISTYNPVPGRVAVRVRDTGIGIPETDIKSIFLAFNQGGLTGRHQFGGLGLGLSISRAIVDAHGGEIVAESAGSGKGAVFTMLIDAAPGPANEHAPYPRNDVQLLPLRLLLVEDHLESLNAMSRLLERDGHFVVRATNMQEALAQAAANQCDVVISDIGLPDGDGYAVMSQIRERFGLPGIALSGYGMEADLRKSSAAGFAAHLVKPIELARLREVIASVMNKFQPSQDVHG
ncbi:ATP-binding protein [Prosthecobacter sp.]|uniref:hybrid sensor histidine kinase/response regulator n=1 Tax=Prosthecobacter sp. TaxID=1965333 RepID=UPI003783A71A